MATILFPIIRLHLPLSVHFLFVPPKEAGRNSAFEYFIEVWKIQILCHRCPDVRALRRRGHRFLHDHHYQILIRSLHTVDHGTRFPGKLRAQR